jgi:hypothetical protein
VPCALLLGALILSTPAPSSAADYFVTVYAGKYSDNTLGHILVSKPIEFWHSYLAVIAIAKIFPLASPAHQWEVEAQVGQHFAGQHHAEINAAVIYRWQRFPWNHYLKTSIALGDGFSYATEVPPLELNSPTNEGSAHTLNYIVLETTFAPPWAKNWSLVTRVHHRSGVYGLFNDVDGGSNVVAVGMKFRF